MMEKTQNSTTYISFQKKIVSYLDGSLSSDDKSEFEAFVRTHPEFEAQIKTKEDEISLLKSLIPVMTLSKESLESLKNEMKLSILNLLKEEPKSFMEKIKFSWEEWINR